MHPYPPPPPPTYFWHVNKLKLKYEANDQKIIIVLIYLIHYPVAVNFKTSTI